MNIRMICALGIGSVAAAFSMAGAQAAETVIGAGPAALCYQAAEQGRSARDYMTFCYQALASGLTVGDRAATHVNRGVLELSLAEYNAAQDDFNAGLAINPNMGDGYVDRGATLIAQQKYAEAIADIDRGLALGSKKPHIAYYDRGMANEALGNLQAAYNDYRQALLIAPDFTLASDELKRFKIVERPSGA